MRVENANIDALNVPWLRSKIGIVDQVRDAFKKKVHMEGNLPYRGGGGSTKSLVKF